MELIRAPPGAAAPMTIPSPSTAPAAEPDSLVARAPPVTEPDPMAARSLNPRSKVAEYAEATRPKKARTAVFILKIS